MRLINRNPGRVLTAALAALPFAALLIAWMIASNNRLTTNPSDKLLPALSTVGEAAERRFTEPGERSGRVLLWHNTWASLERRALGLGICATLATTFGLPPYVRSTPTGFVAVAEGELIFIVGASGCGKPTFLRLLRAQQPPTRGTIRVAGADPAVDPGRGRGVVFQCYSVFPYLTVRDNVVVGESFRRPWGRAFGAEKRQARVRARVGRDHVADADADADPATLSGGMQQPLAIGQALTACPRILLLDELFGAPDPGTRASMHAVLTDLRGETSMTVYMVTRDLEEGFKPGDRVLVFDKPRRDPDDPDLYGATLTCDFDARDGGIPLQRTLEDTHVSSPA